MALGERHGRVEAYDREQARDVENSLNDLFTHCRVEVVELGGVIPRKTCAIVTVVEVANFAA